MNDRRIPLEKEEPKHKKKSKAKGLSRSKHKHEYEPVLLHRPFFNIFKQENEDIISVTKVCKICGRIDANLHGEEWYDTEDTDVHNYIMGYNVLNKKTLTLPKWYTHDFWDKFAYRGE